jgi:hypothetical protein
LSTIALPLVTLKRISPNIKNKYLGLPFVDIFGSACSLHDIAVINRRGNRQGYEPTVNLIAKSQSKNMVFDFTQNDTSKIPVFTLRIPSYGVATVPLTIASSENASAGPYTLFIFANSSFPSEELIKPEGFTQIIVLIFSLIPLGYPRMYLLNQIKYSRKPSGATDWNRSDKYLLG